MSNGDTTVAKIQGTYMLKDGKLVSGKGTSVCRNCRWPVDVYEDGTIKDSPLAECRGRPYTIGPFGFAALSSSQALSRSATASAIATTVERMVPGGIEPPLPT